LTVFKKKGMKKKKELKYNGRGELVQSTLYA
jgi:hypothetical protein